MKHRRQTFLYIFGTRPEAIKLAPLIKLSQVSPNVDTKICITSQHMSMLTDVLSFFDIKPDYDLNIMLPNQNLYELTSRLVEKLAFVFDELSPDYVFVQGDTASSFIGALGSYYSKIPVVHIEAGLRSYHKFSPYPEEMNRQLISRLADYHFVPTESAKQNLIKEGIRKNVFVVGNTVVDALHMTQERLKEHDGKNFKNSLAKLGVDFSKNLALITLHRRETFGKPLDQCCLALSELSDRYDHFQFVFPVHYNPIVQQTIREKLSHYSNICLLDPLAYPYFVYLMNQSKIILTDSGGIQEEAPSLNKPVLVMRDVTERIEAIEQGIAILVGTNSDSIIASFERYISGNLLEKGFSLENNPYGDGHANQRIMDILTKGQTNSLIVE